MRLNMVQLDDLSDSIIELWNEIVGADGDDDSTSIHINENAEDRTIRVTLVMSVEGRGVVLWESTLQDTPLNEVVKDVLLKYKAGPGTIVTGD